jgi:hypothetical protein
MKIRLLLAGLIIFASVPVFGAGALTQSTFTEIIKQANVEAAADKSVSPAQVNEVFRVPDVVRTGSNSRLEMTAPDKTITRVGENSAFTFEPGTRDIRLEKGSVLFHPPAGVGGGTVKYGGTSAAVLGTTMVCFVGPGGVFNIVVLEGEALVTLANGQTVQVGPGQTVSASADGNSFSPVMDVHLGQFASHLLLLRGFSTPLSSMPLIEAAIQLQNEQVASGKRKFNFQPLQTTGEGLELVLNKYPDISVTLSGNDLTIIPISPTTGAK